MDRATRKTRKEEAARERERERERKRERDGRDLVESRTFDLS
jgi:hypothetical protein